jgi:N-acetylglucosaminyldiphosphoundecaprenol N-acetyl-beta-D-mannosaminyltransferase
MNKISLYGVRLKRMSQKDADDKICSSLKRGGQTVVFTPNLQMISAAKDDVRLCVLLNSADILLPDGVGINILCKRLGLLPGERITGIDTAFSLLTYAAARGYRVFLLGGQRGVAELAARKLRKKLPSLCVCGTHHGYFDKKRESPQNQAVLKKIKQARPDILFVCLGFPTQEVWIKQNARLLPDVKLFMGLGGSLDVWSGRLCRAPRLVQRIKLEWLWRCICEPKRFLPLIKACISLKKP